MSRFRSIVFLSGGVGGARLLHGFSAVVPPAELTAIVNTGDDFVHWGLPISPDLDTVMYALAGLSDDARGWGLADESFRTLERMKALGAPSWFALGDKDLATHLVRRDALAAGATLTAVTEQLCRAHGVEQRVLPMCDGPRRTLIDTFEHGTLPFQNWLVEHRAPSVRAIRFEGESAPSRAVLTALRDADLVVIGPSNPYVSIDPILTLTGVREALAGKLVIALSPLVNGRAIKGPLADMVHTLSGREPSAGAIAHHYAGLLAAMVVERGDEPSVEGVKTYGTDTVMRGLDTRAQLAREMLAFAERLT